MDRELTDAEIDAIVNAELAKLEREYQEVKKYDIKPLTQAGTDKQLETALHQETEDNNEGKVQELNQQNRNEDGSEEEEEIPYQTIDQDQEGGLFDDDDQEQEQGAQVVKPQEQCNEPEIEVKDTQQQQSVQAEVVLEPQIRPIKPIPDQELQKIRKIASNIQITQPDWMKDPQKCAERIKQLFSKPL